MRKQKLELTWIGKENRPWLEPRILLEVPSQSYGAATRVTANDLFTASSSATTCSPSRPWKPSSAAR